MSSLNKKNHPLIKASVVLVILAFFTNPTIIFGEASSSNYNLERESFSSGVETDSTSPNYIIHGEVGDSAKTVGSQNYDMGSGLEFLDATPMPTPTEATAQSSGSGGSSGSGSSSVSTSNSTTTSTPSIVEKATQIFKKTIEKTKENLVKLPAQINKVKKTVGEAPKKNPIPFWTIIASVIAIFSLIVFFLIKRRRKRDSGVSGFGVGAPGQN